LSDNLINVYFNDGGYVSSNYTVTFASGVNTFGLTLLSSFGYNSATGTNDLNKMWAISVDLIKRPLTNPPEIVSLIAIKNA
jgi:hypothetical protein